LLQKAKEILTELTLKEKFSASQIHNTYTL